MSQVPQKRSPRRGRILPERTLAPEELAFRKAQRAELGKRCRQIFERLRPELLEKHYNWFIAIEPESEEYLIDPKLDNLLKKVSDRYGNCSVKLTTFRLNETGACGNI